jgi:uncharacterized membrane protein
MMIRGEYFQGPLPPPALLEAYERTLPGAADRIFTHAEEQGRHRRAAETRSLELLFRAEARGQWLAAAIVMLGMILGAALIATSHEVWGLVSLLAPLAGAAGIFVYARREQTQERAQRRRDLLRSQPDIQR